MEVYLLCIAVEGSDDRVAWSTFIVEPEGFVEEKSGLASSFDRAMLWAIKEGVWGVPSNAHVAVRSTCGPLLRLGEKHLSSLSGSEALREQDSDLLTSIVDRIEGQTLAWLRPPFLEAGDSRTIQLAKEIVKDPMSSYAPEEVDFIMQSYDVHDEEVSIASKPSVDLIDDIEEQDTSLIQSPILPKDASSLSKERENLRDAAAPPDNTPHKEESQNQDLTSETNEEDIEPETKSTTKTYKPKLTSKLPPPPAKKTQLHVEGPDYLFGARIVAYVDGIGAGNLGAWSFVLVDRQTGFALARANGMRASTPYRSRLIACIEVISALKAINQEIEVRSRWQKLIKLGDQWMHKWKNKNWKKSGNEPIQEVGYIQQLDALSSQHRMSWLYIPDHNDEHGIQFAKHLAKQALNDINAGHKHVYSERLKDFPTDKLL